MLGFFSCALALGVPAAPNSVATIAKVILIFPLHFIDFLPFFFSTTNANEPAFRAGQSLADFQQAAY
jgi:hypothetical protein